MNPAKSRTLMAAAVALLIVVQASADPVGTAFTYQGQLNEGGLPVDGAYDLVFRLFDAETGPAQTGDDLYFDDWPIAGGLLTVELSFDPSPFTGDALWLEVGVRPSSSIDDYEILSPRQPLTAAPFAAYALDGPGGAGYWEADGDDILNTNIGDVGIGTDTPAGQLALGAYQGGTETSLVEGYDRQLVLSGEFNTGVNTGEAVKLLISDYNNDPGSDICPIYVEDENNWVHFYLRSIDGIRRTFFGGDVGIGTNLPSNPLSVAGDADVSGNLGIAAPTPEVRLHVQGGTDASLGGGGFLQLGHTTGQNLVMDENEIMTRNNGGLSNLHINRDGGNTILNEFGGRVGVGEGTPLAKLDVYATAGIGIRSTGAGSPCLLLSFLRPPRSWWFGAPRTAPTISYSITSFTACVSDSRRQAWCGRKIGKRGSPPWHRIASATRPSRNCGGSTHSSGTRPCEPKSARPIRSTWAPPTPCVTQSASTTRPFTGSSGRGCLKSRKPRAIVALTIPIGRTICATGARQ